VISNVSLFFSFVHNVGYSCLSMSLFCSGGRGRRRQSASPSRDASDSQQQRRRRHRRVNCQMSSWSSWTACPTTASCDAVSSDTFSTRERHVIREPQNGGRACPARLSRRRRCRPPAHCDRGTDAEICPVSQSEL